MKKISNRKITAFQKRILSYYHKNKRDLPWRKTKDPYHILVSEIMLQQTQVDRVIPYYERFLKSFPTPNELVKADKKILLNHWSGLGYNSRVLRLQQLAQHVVKHNNGKIPKMESELLDLPGIGPYTAHAILAFAYNKSVPVMDTNIRRVLIHEFQLPEETSLDELQVLALRCVPEGKSCIWHNAMMDYGATKQTARKTGIKPLSQQSSFKGSDREVRGSIIKTLTKQTSVQIKKIQTPFPNKDVAAIVKKMEKEGIVKVSGTTIRLG